MVSEHGIAAIPDDDRALAFQHGAAADLERAAILHDDGAGIDEHAVRHVERAAIDDDGACVVEARPGIERGDEEIAIGSSAQEYEKYEKNKQGIIDKMFWAIKDRT